MNHHAGRLTYFFRWNTLEIVLDNLLLIAHHALMRAYGGVTFHGELALIFSFLYLAIHCAVAGLDSVLALFWSRASQSKTSAHQFLGLVAIQQIALLLIYAGGACALSIFLPSYGAMIFSLVSPLLFGSVILIEIGKRCLKSLALFARGPRLVTFIEIGGLLTYLVGIWGYYMTRGYSLSASLIALSMISLLQASIYVFVLCSKVRQLPATSESFFPVKDFFAYRCMISINHIIAQFFTANFIIPCIAWWCSWSFISAAKIVASGARLVMRIIQKGIGLTALLVHAEHQSYSPLVNMIPYLHRLIAGLLALLLVTAPFFAAATCSVTWQHVSVLFLLFTILALSEAIYTLYDRLLTLEKQLTPLIIISVITAGMVGTVLIEGKTYDSFLLKALIMIRLCSLFFLMSYLVWFYHTKKILPPSLKKEFIIVGVLLILSGLAVFFSN